ncbi:MAG: recombinase family protein, partial [Thermoproteota archaeon]
RILKALVEGKADVILAEYKDRLTRFGFNYLSLFAQSHGARIETVYDDVKKDATQELIEDMVSVVQSFSARLYGRRSHKYKQIVEGIKNAAHNTC